MAIIIAVKFRAWGLALRAMLIESSCKLAAFGRASKYRAGDRKVGRIQLWSNPAGASQRTQTNRNFLLRGTRQSGWLRKTFYPTFIMLDIYTFRGCLSSTFLSAQS